MKKVFLIILSLFALNAQARSLEQIQKSGYINVAVYANQPPFGYIDASDEFQGFDVNLGRRIAADLGVEPRFVVTTTEDKIDVARCGDADISLANCTQTNERKQAVDFANPYMKTTLGVLSSKEKPILHISQIRSARLAVVKNSTAAHYWHKRINEDFAFKDVEMREVGDDEIEKLLLNGEVDAYCNDEVVLAVFERLHWDFILGLRGLGDTLFIAPVVQKGNSELLAWLNEEIEILRRNGFFEKNYELTIEGILGRKISVKELLVREFEILGTSE